MQPARLDVDLHIDEGTFEAYQSAASDLGQHGVAA
jgi:hypothetical protein